MNKIMPILVLLSFLIALALGFSGIGGFWFFIGLGAGLTSFYLYSSCAVSTAIKDKGHYHRMVFFILICRLHKSRAWKTRKSTKSGHFTVGVDTPKGVFVQQYPLKHWNRFHVKELSKLPNVGENDEKEADRLLSL